MSWRSIAHEFSYHFAIDDDLTQRKDIEYPVSYFFFHKKCTSIYFGEKIASKGLEVCVPLHIVCNNKYKSNKISSDCFISDFEVQNYQVTF